MSSSLSEARFDVVGIGNAIVDVVVQADEAFVRDNALDKGVMTLIDEARSDELYALMPPGRHQTPKVKAFIDFLVERLGAGPWRERQTQNQILTGAILGATGK